MGLAKYAFGFAGLITLPIAVMFFRPNLTEADSLVKLGQGKVALIDRDGDVRIKSIDPEDLVQAEATQKNFKSKEQVWTELGQRFDNSGLEKRYRQLCRDVGAYDGQPMADKENPYARALRSETLNMRLGELYRQCERWNNEKGKTGVDSLMSENQKFIDAVNELREMGNPPIIPDPKLAAQLKESPTQKIEFNITR